MSFIYFLLILTCPIIFGQYAQLWKCLVLGIGCCIFFQMDRKWWSMPYAMHLGWKTVVAALVVLACVWASVFTSPIVPWHLGIFGEKDRSEGAIAITLAVVWGLFCCWPARKTDEALLDLFQNRSFLSFGCVMAGLLMVSTTIWLTCGWNTLTSCVGRPLGVAMLAGLAIPYLFSMVYYGNIGVLFRVLASLSILLGVIFISSGGIRCALVGAVAGCVTVALLSKAFHFQGSKNHQKRIAVAFTVIAASIIIFLGSSAFMQKAKAINIFGIGNGPRSELAHQAWDRGTFIFGWGLESQRELIDHKFELFQRAPYDRFHCWPVDVWITLGFVGTAAVLFFLWRLVTLAYRNSWDYGQKGLAGIIVSFLFMCMWNPPTVQMIAITASAVGGLCLSWRGWDSIPSNRYRHPVYFGVKPVVYLLTFSMFIMYIGDVLNWDGMRRAGFTNDYPHIGLSEQAVAVKINPWTWRDRVNTYWLLHKHGYVKEPQGGKKMLLEIMHLNPRLYEWEAILWCGFGDEEAGKRQLEKAITEKITIMR